MTVKYPDVSGRIPGVLNEGVESVVLDGEIVAWDEQHKKFIPFQVRSKACTHTHTHTRARACTGIPRAKHHQVRAERGSLYR